MYKILYWSRIVDFMEVRGNYVQILLHINNEVIVIIVSQNNVKI